MRNPECNERGNVMVVILTVAAVVAFIVYYQARSKDQPETAIVPPAAVTPPTQPPVVEPEPTPEPAPIVKATPVPTLASTPTPTLVTLAEIARDRSLWPRVVHLRKNTTFPVVINGRVAGTAEIPARTPVRVVNLSASLIEIEHSGGRVVVPAGQTDVLDLVRQVALQSTPNPSL